MLPVLSDMQRILRQLAVLERARIGELARLEDRLRRFEDIERPAYEHWRRLAFGPVLATLDELLGALHARRTLAQRVTDLVERAGLPPREALYVATHPDADGRGAPSGADPDEVDARRRAKLERKRAARKHARRSETSPAPIVPLYRALARRLHPDSPTAVRVLEPAQVRTLWADVQTAYQARSLERLQAIAVWLEASAAGDVAEHPPATPQSLGERHARLRVLARSCRALERRLTELEADRAWGFLDTSERSRRTLEKTVARDIEADMARVREALDGFDDFLTSIGSPRAPRPERRR